MVFGFGKKKSNKEAQSAPEIRASPSLPDLSQARQAVVWPTSLVDQEEVQQVRANKDLSKTIPYHKPFRPYSSVTGTDEHGRRSTAVSDAPPSAFSPNRMSTVSGTTTATGTRRTSTRRQKVAPSFNIMVAGGRQTGKTSFLRLLLETADISPTASLEQRAELESFLAHRPKRTTSFNSVRVEIMESPTDRMLLTVIDTPGLDFNPGRELVLEQQTNALVHELDSRFAETLIEESKVIRTSKGDQHIHLCIYLIDPVTSIIDRKHEARTADLQQHTPPETSPLAVHSSDSEYDESESEPESPSPGQHQTSRRPADHIHLRQSEIRTLRRLAPKVNLLPVIARMDSMTDARLRAVKKAVRRELEEAGIGFGVFSLSPASDPTDPETTPKKAGDRPTTAPSGLISHEEGSPSQPPGLSDAPNSPISPTDSSMTEDGDSRKTVIKIRPIRFPAELSRKRSQSRIRRAHMQSNESDEEFEIARAKASIKEATKVQDEQSGMDYDARRKRMSFASMRFFDHTRALLSRDAMEGVGGNAAAHREVDRLLPFALVNPEQRSSRRRRPTSFQPSPSVDTNPDAEQIETSLFTRKFRWGTIDVLNASHCDFVPMRTAVFGSHLKALRKRTKDAYEQYRTEKLLIRKAKKARQSLHPQDPSGGSRDGSVVGTLAEGGSWVDVATNASKLDVPQTQGQLAASRADISRTPTQTSTSPGKVRNGSAHGHGTATPRSRRNTLTKPPPASLRRNPQQEVVVQGQAF